MTYGEMRQEIKKINMDDIVDYRPAAGMFIDGMNEDQQIPSAIVCWLKNGDQIIYVCRHERIE